MKLYSQQKSIRGFTLLELMIVLVIISIILTLTWVSWQGFAEHYTLRVTAEQWIDDVQRVRQEAILRATSFGFKLNSKGYAVFIFTTKQQWEPYHAIQPVIFKTPLQITWLLGGDTSLPIQITASGELTPFRMQWRVPKTSQMVMLQRDPHGQIQLR